MDPYTFPRWAPGTGQGDAWRPRSTREWRVPRERGACHGLGGLPDVMPAFPAGRAKGWPIVPRQLWGTRAVEGRGLLPVLPDAAA